MTDISIQMTVSRTTTGIMIPIGQTKAWMHMKIRIKNKMTKTWAVAALQSRSQMMRRNTGGGKSEHRRGRCVAGLPS